MTTRESLIVTAAKVTDKLGKLPPGAFDISNDKERTRLLWKTFVFLLLDLILLGVLVYSLTRTLKDRKNAFCKTFFMPLISTIIAFVFCSLVVDAAIWCQIQRNYISKQLAVANLVLDIGILACAVWEVILIVNMTTTCD